ncbi:MAG: transposase, partial [Nakamurella sp.]
MCIVGPEGEALQRFMIQHNQAGLKEMVRRLRPLERDTAATTALRTTVRARKDMAIHRVATANQLRAHLQIVFPAAAGLFEAIDSEVSLRFLDR